MSEKETLKNLSPASFLEKVELERGEEEKLNKNKWFWEERDESKSLVRDQLRRKSLPKELLEITRKRVKDSDGMTSSILAAEVYIDWIKASEIVNKEKNRKLEAIIDKAESMDEEISNLKNSLGGKNNRISSLEKTLSKNEQKIRNFGFEQQKILKNLQDEKKSISLRLEAIGSYPIDSLPYRIKMAEIEAYNAKRDFILEEQKNIDLNSLLEVEKEKNKNLLEKYKDDLNDKLAELERLQKRTKDQDKIIGSYAEDFKKEFDKAEQWEKSYHEEFKKRTEIEDKLKSYQRIDKKIGRSITNAKASVTRLATTIIYGIVATIGLVLLGIVTTVLKWVGFFRIFKRVEKPSLKSSPRIQPS